MNCLRNALPRAWESSHQAEADYIYSLESDGKTVVCRGIHELARGSLEDAVAALVGDLPSLFPKISTTMLFVEGRILNMGSGQTMIVGAVPPDLVEALEFSDSTDLVAFDRNGRVRLFSNPTQNLEIHDFVQFQIGPGNGLRALSPAKMGGVLFQHKKTPLREVGDWLGVVAKMTQSARSHLLQYTDPKYLRTQWTSLVRGDQISRLLGEV